MNKNVWETKHCGVTFGFCAKNGYYSSAKAKDEVDEIAKTGANWIVLIVTVMQNHYYSTQQFRDFEKTPNDIELKEIIDYIHSKGIKVQLRPMLECFDGEGRLSVFFPADRERMPGLACTYCSSWFESMKKRSSYYAHIAEITGCEMYCIDSELDRIIRFSPEWKEVIRVVREAYSGPVTSCHTMNVDFERVLLDKEHWFYDLDALSLSDYIKAADKDGATAEEMAVHMEKEREKLRRIAAMYGKPIIFGEIGCTSTVGAAKNPSGFSVEDSVYCEEEQANYLEAVMRTFIDEPWWHGLYWWKWDEQVARPWMTDPTMEDKGFTVRGKKAAEIMKTWFTKVKTE